MGQPGVKTGNIPSEGRQGINALNFFLTHHFACSKRLSSLLVNFTYVSLDHT